MCIVAFAHFLFWPVGSSYICVTDKIPSLSADLEELKELITEAEEKRFPDDDLLQTLISAVSEAEKCANVANQLVTKKVRTR